MVDFKKLVKWLKDNGENDFIGGGFRAFGINYHLPERGFNYSVKPELTAYLRHYGFIVEITESGLGEQVFIAKGSEGARDKYEYRPKISCEMLMLSHLLGNNLLDKIDDVVLICGVRRYAQLIELLRVLGKRVHILTDGITSKKDGMLWSPAFSMGESTYLLNTPLMRELLEAPRREYEESPAIEEDDDDYED